MSVAASLKDVQMWKIWVASTLFRSSALSQAYVVKNEEVRVQGFQADLQLEVVQEAILPDSGLAPQKENKL